MTTRVLGIDVSSDTFHVALQGENGWMDNSFANSRAGCAQLGRWLKRNGADQVLACVEASGNYWVDVATWLYEHGHQVHRANPLSIRRFIESDLERTKTDKQDARHIGAYIVSRMALPGAVIRLWEPPCAVQYELRALSRRLEELIASRTAIVNRSKDPQVTAFVARGYKRDLTHLDRERERVEAEIDRLIAKDDGLRPSPASAPPPPASCSLSWATVSSSTAPLSSSPSSGSAPRSDSLAPRCVAAMLRLGMATAGSDKLSTSPPLRHCDMIPAAKPSENGTPPRTNRP